MRLTCWFNFIVILLVLPACADRAPTGTQIPAVNYFAKTGHTVQGEFLQFFEAYGGVESLGYPLTQEIVVEGWTVQYFEKGRLERHPENEPAYRITVGWLGDLLHRRRPPVPATLIPPANDPQRRYFPQTGHTVSGDFWRYFQTHGGSVRFGLPISEPFLWEGQLTQDFQSARFFWTPELTTPVRLEAIGRVHFEASGLDKALLQPVEN
ncbi:MAG: hypothetical protein AB1801_17085 [Chloroflexota bacterium]